MSFRFQEFVSAATATRNGTIRSMAGTEKQLFVTRALSYRGEKGGDETFDRLMDVGRLWAVSKVNVKSSGGLRLEWWIEKAGFGEKIAGWKRFMDRWSGVKAWEIRDWKNLFNSGTTFNDW